jgi:hypothetical protein
MKSGHRLASPSLVRSLLEPAVELRLSKTRRRLAKDLVSLSEFADLILHRLHLIGYFRCNPGALPAVSLSLCDPAPSERPARALPVQTRSSSCSSSLHSFKSWCRRQTQRGSVPARHAAVPCRKYARSGRCELDVRQSWRLHRRSCRVSPSKRVAMLVSKIKHIS